MIALKPREILRVIGGNCNCMCTCTYKKDSCESTKSYGCESTGNHLVGCETDATSCYYLCEKIYSKIIESDCMPLRECK